MKILIDILHPAHVHFFHAFHDAMKERGHEVLITARAKECSLELLEHFGFPYRLLSRQQNGVVGLGSELIRRTVRLAQVVREYKPTVMTGIMGPSIAITGAIQRVPAIVFYDTEFATQTNWFTYPLAHSVCTPDCYQARVSGLHRTYAGYHELAYLHPTRFTPDPGVLEDFGVTRNEQYSLVRFVHWKAVHDRGERGLSIDEKRELVELLLGHGRVLISSEGPVPPDLEDLRIRGPIADIHHLLAYAQLIVGESATMSSEAAVLGVPAVFIATTSRGYIDDQERRYGHVRYFREDQFSDALGVIDRLLKSRTAREMGARARERLLEDKIDVTQWMIEYFETQFGSGGR